MGTDQTSASESHADSAVALGERTSRLRSEDDYGRTFSSIVNRPGSSVHAFLKELVATTRRLPKFSHDEFPPLIPHPVGLPIAGSTIGTAFGWLVRMKNERQLQTVEAQQGAINFQASGIRFAHEGFAAVDRRAADIACGNKDAEVGELERLAVVLAWFEEGYRGGAQARMYSPLAANGLDIGNAEALLDMVPDAGATHLAQLGTLADEKLQPFLDDSSSVQFGVRLGPQHIPADADLIADEILLELKCTQGEKRAGGYEFSLTPALMRQVVGYLLLDEFDNQNCSVVGVYGARYGVLWTMDAETMFSVVGSIEPNLAKLRAAFRKALP